MKTTIGIQGMHCASCAAIIEKTLQKDNDVSSISVNYANETATIDFNSNKTSLLGLSNIIKPLGYTFNILPAENPNNTSAAHQKITAVQNLKQKLGSVLPLAVLSILIMGWDIGANFNLLPKMPAIAATFFHHLLPIIATYVFIVVGKPYILGVYRFLRYGKANMDTLIGIGTLSAFLYSFIITAFENVLRPFLNVEHTYYDVTIVVIAFISLGKYLEAKAKLKTGDAIEKLLQLQAKTALVLRNNTEAEIPLSEIVVGDVIIIKPGAKIPVDGIIVKGASYIDEAMITGEAMPVRKSNGDVVIGGTINGDGAFTFTATKIGADTMLAHIIAMVQNAQGSKAPIQRLADHISAIFVPIVLGLSLLTLAAWLVLGPSTLGFGQALSYGLAAFVSILVIACPCALGLATPTAIIVGVGKGAKEGILIKDASSLEILHKVTTVVVDKTGTITKGAPTVVSIEAFGEQTEGTIISILSSLESRSEHPIAKAIMAHAAQLGISPSALEDFEIIKGQGLTGRIDGKIFFAGNAALINSLPFQHALPDLEKENKQGQTPIILASSNELLGIVMVADAIKPEAAAAVARLHKMSIKVIMLSGDNIHTATRIATEAGITEVAGEVLPADKLEVIKKLQQAGEIVAMAGDGINDAPALAQADIGIAMATGTDVAIESAGIILLHGDISKLLKAIRLSKITIRGIKQNLFWAFIYNIIGIPLAAGILFPFFGWMLNPIFAGLAMAGSSVSVVLNSLRLKTISL